jgi:hypothetical protein
MEIGQKVVFVRDVNGAGVGKHGIVMRVADDAILVGCKLHGHLAPVMAQMWDLLPERLWNRSQYLPARRKTESAQSHLMTAP